MNEINMNSQPNLKLSINKLKVTIHHKIKMNERQNTNSKQNLKVQLHLLQVVNTWN